MSNNRFQNILAIDTSSSYLRLAVSSGVDRIVKLNERVDRSHGRLIVKKMGDLMLSGGLKPDDLQALVVCTGPGSFTGLRIGLAAAKGMAVALDIPIVGISLFQMAAHRLRDEDHKVRIVIGLNRDECLLAPVGKGSFDAADIRVVAYTELATVVGEDRLLGVGVTPDLGRVDRTDLIEYDAADLLTLGQNRLTVGDYDDLAALEPLYVQKSRAELRFEQQPKKK
ncbi:MAG: tRNA (adenosine(37)-N6)-threonylcarbamoyltransferase complex dimerization subunit type 1 TsaB [bacterium]